MPTSKRRKKNGKTVKPSPKVAPNPDKIHARLVGKDKEIDKHLKLDRMSNSALRLMAVSSFKKEIFWQEHIEHKLELIENLTKSLKAVRQTERRKLKAIIEGACERISWLDKFEDSEQFSTFLDWLVTNDIVAFEDGTPLEASIQDMETYLKEFKERCCEDANTFDKG